MMISLRGRAIEGAATGTDELYAASRMSGVGKIADERRGS